MFSTFIKSVLIFNRAQNKAPNFFLVYLLISITWHYQVFIAFAASNAGLSDRLSAALSEHSFQYTAVLFLTFLFFTLRLSLLYFVNKTDQFIEADEPIEAKIGSDQVFNENKDVIRLLALLEETKAQLAKVKAREANAQADRTSAISKMLTLQAELDIAMADIAILGKSNEELSAKLNQYKVV